MSYVAPDSDLRTPTISSSAVSVKFAGTPLQGYEGTFWALAGQYGIDPNWALAYLQWESGFGRNDPSGQGMAFHNNPWDMVACAAAPSCDCPADQCYQSPYNSWWYYRYPSVAAGLEAGFQNWAGYVRRGAGTWQAGLMRASGNNANWTASVIAQGQYNAEHWPYDGSSAPPPVGAPDAPPPGPRDPPVSAAPTPGDLLRANWGWLAVGVLGITLVAAVGGKSDTGQDDILWK